MMVPHQKINFKAVLKPEFKFTDNALKDHFDATIKIAPRVLQVKDRKLDHLCLWKNK